MRTNFQQQRQQQVMVMVMVNRPKEEVWLLVVVEKEKTVMRGVMRFGERSRRPVQLARGKIRFNGDDVDEFDGDDGSKGDR
ncbi:hypothetical protein Q3G72_011421 [Acer saccharum]|nr:hypothetical protein Q3G72_004855 [Acer saccharum]KAK1582051.1 hypothetical protein Q3G72_011421 [Acer saccharum]